MAKFEVGQKVRVKSGTYGLTDIGSVGVVVADPHPEASTTLVDFRDCPRVRAEDKRCGHHAKDNEFEFYMATEDLQLLEEAPSVKPSPELDKEDAANPAPIVLRNKATVPFDVDQTLVMWSHGALPEEGTMPVKWQGTTYHLKPHAKHVHELKEHAKNGKAVIVWSRRGYDWAEAVVNALGLSGSVSLILEKPFIYYDDIEAHEFMYRIYHSQS